MLTSYVIDAVRTPRGRGKAGKGALSAIHPQELFAQTLVAACRPQRLRSGRRRGRRRGLRVARSTNRGPTSRATPCWPRAGRSRSARDGEPLLRIGAQAVNFAAMGVAFRSEDLAVAGGVESMSRVPIGADGGGHDGDNVRAAGACLQVPQGISADLIATLEGLLARGRGSGSRFDPSSSPRGQSRRVVFKRSLFAVKDPRERCDRVRARRDSAPGHDARRARRAQAASSWSSGHAGGSQRRVLDGDRLARPTPRRSRSTTCIPPATPAGSSTARRRVRLASEGYVRATGAAARAPASAPWRRSGASR